MSELTDLLAELQKDVNRVLDALDANTGAGEDVEAAKAGLRAMSQAIDDALPEIPEPPAPPEEPIG